MSTLPPFRERLRQATREQISSFGYMVLLLWTLGPIGFQTFTWLKTGQWRPLPIGLALPFFGLEYPGVNWLGVQKVIDWVLAIPMGLVTFITGMAVCARLLDRADRRFRKKGL